MTILLLVLVTSVGNNFKFATATVFDYIGISEIRAYDATGQKIGQIQTGQQVSIRGNYTNNLDAEQPFTIITEVRDGSGLTVYLAWHSAKLKPHGTYAYETSWMVDRVCWIDNQGCNNYQIRSFVISEIENPQLLSTVHTSGRLTVMGDTMDGFRVWMLDVAGSEYPVQYRLERGYVKNVIFEPYLSTIIIQLVANQDSILQVILPEGVNSRMHCSAEPVPGGSDVELEVFIDTIPGEINETSRDGMTILEVLVDSGAEEVEFVGACIE